LRKADPRWSAQIIGLLGPLISVSLIWLLRSGNLARQGIDVVNARSATWPIEGGALRRQFVRRAWFKSLVNPSALVSSTVRAVRSAGLVGDILPGLEEFIESPAAMPWSFRIVEDQLNLRERFLRGSELPPTRSFGTQTIVVPQSYRRSGRISVAVTPVTDLTRLTILGQAFAEGDLLPGVALGC
jgi:hypothetical protein